MELSAIASTLYTASCLICFQLIDSKATFLNWGCSAHLCQRCLSLAKCPICLPDLQILQQSKLNPNLINVGISFDAPIRPTGQIATDITRSLSSAPSPQRWLTLRNKQRFQVIELAHFEDSSIRNIPSVIIVQMGLCRTVQQHIEHLACIECDFHIPFNSDKLLISKFNADVLQTVLSGHSSGCTKPSLYYSQHYSLTGVSLLIYYLLLYWFLIC